MSDEIDDDDPVQKYFYRPKAPQAPPRQPQAGELLYEFHVAATHRFYRVELRDHGPYGVEAQFFDPIDLVIARTFRRGMDPARTPRAVAIAWADEQRKYYEQATHRDRARR